MALVFGTEDKMKLTSKYIWDYDVKTIDLSNPRALLWYLNRKVEYGDWEALDKQTLKKYLSKLKIDPYLKRVLNVFVAQ